MTNNMTMIMVNIHEAKAHLSEYLNRLDTEEEIVLCKRNIPVAVIKALPPSRKERVIGLEKGLLTVPDAFFEPLPDDLLALYSGENG